MSRKRASSPRRREEILDVALEIIFKKGFYNLTIRNIAEKIGISEAAIYRHYRNKEEIINKLTDLIFMKEDIWGFTEQEVDPFERLEGIMEKQLHFFEDNPCLAGITFQDEIFREYPGVREKFNRCRVFKEKGLIKIIMHAQKIGRVRESVNPENFAVIFLGTIRMSVLRWKNSNFNYSLAGKTPELCQELFKILK